MLMLFRKYKARIEQLETQNKELEKTLLTLKSQLPRLLELSKFLTDLETLNGSLLSVKRIKADEVYVWRE